MSDLGSAPFILGTQMVGGKPAKKAKKQPVTKKVKKTKKMQKQVKSKESIESPSFSFFGGMGGAEMQMEQTAELNHAMQILGGKVKKPKKSSSLSSIKSAYKKYLNNLTAERLYKIARAKGLTVYTKKNGRIAYVKKATIVKKLCELKHGK